MPITPFLAGKPFDQEAIDVMSAAFTAVCSKLGLTDRSDPASGIARTLLKNFSPAPPATRSPADISMIIEITANAAAGQ